jgi:CHAT domain/FHA domain
MSRPDSPCLSIAIARLKIPGNNHFASWVLLAPNPSGYVHHDCVWPETLSETWHAWLEMFSQGQTMPVGVLHQLSNPQSPLNLPTASTSGKNLSYSSRLMQHLGINLWQWLFDGPIQTSLHESRGIAIGQNQPLRVRLDLREADLIALPWEIMQPLGGQGAISLSQQLLFSRTTSNVDPLPTQQPAQCLKILLVLGEEEKGKLKLEEEAATLAQVLQLPTNIEETHGGVPCRVDTLIQPTPSELIAQLETGDYNVLFYAGHGKPGPDGGLLFLRPNTTLNGTELAQVLVRCRITLGVFNACWGAQPAVEFLPNTHQLHPIPQSSLAEVLIHHGVPAVLAMRDAIADREALSFIQGFAQGLIQRLTIDQAVAVARQQLLTLYKFNQPAWTLPVLYMHPEFNGALIESLDDIKTELPRNSPTWVGRSLPTAYLRSRNSPQQMWPILGGLVRVGRGEDNDIAIVGEQWVSQKHAEIFCRNKVSDTPNQPTYFLRDFSRYGTLIFGSEGWQRIHHQEIPLSSGMLLKFGSSQGQIFEFLIESQKT